MENSSNEAEQKKLKAFLERRHPEYEAKLPHWEFLEATYEGGREWFAPNIFRYLKEGDKEFFDRLARAYRFNHTREVVDLVNKHLFKQEIARSEDAPESVRRFWKAATLNNLSIKDFMRQVSKETSIDGRRWVVVDNTNTGIAVSIEDEKNGDISTYAYTVSPRDALDMSYDERGNLNWILIHEQTRDDDTPIESSGAVIDRYRLWTRTDWTLFTIEPDPNKPGKFIVIVEGPHAHDLGVVPVFAVDNIVSSEPYCSSALIDDVAYLDRAVANYLSNLDAIIQDQTFSQLAIPAQAMLSGTGGEESTVSNKLIEMGTKRLFAYDGSAGSPMFLSPDVKQAELIMTVVNKIINEIYHTVGLAGERTKDDNSQGIDNSSGVAKAYDFERVNSLLAAKADSLEAIENKLVWYVAKWHGDEKELDDRVVSYPDNFDVRGLYDEFEIAARLSLVEAPETVRRHQMEMLIDKLFPRLKKDLKDKMLADLKTWPPKIETMDANGNPIKKEGTNALASQLVKM